MKITIEDTTDFHQPKRKISVETENDNLTIDGLVRDICAVVSAYGYNDQAIREYFTEIQQSG